MKGYLAKLRGTIRYAIVDPRGPLERRSHRTLARAREKRDRRVEIRNQLEDR